MARFSLVPVLLACAGMVALGGGLAFAQDGLIVDPWGHDSSSWFDGVAPAQGAASRSERTRGAAAFPPEPRSDVVIEPWAGQPSDLWVDTRPKTNAAPRGPVSAAPPKERLVASARPAAGLGWARPIAEIIDPWSRRPGFVAQDPLIVDPWAR